MPRPLRLPHCRRPLTQRPARRDLLVGKRLSEGATSVVYLGRFKNEVRAKRPACRLCVSRHSFAPHAPLVRLFLPRQFVAIKVLRAERLAPRDYDAYLAEVELINKLQHPPVLRFVGVAWAQPNATLVTEWMAGGSLYDMLHAHEKDEDGPTQPRPLLLRQTLRFSEQIASAVAHVHAHGVVHRDIKSCNILLDRERQVVKIADFGLSRHVATQGKSMTAATGTFRWMAPELLSGNGKYGTAVDVYSFGVVIYEMVSGLLPFPLLSPVEAAVRVVRDNLRPDLPDSVPSELAAAVKRCWDADVAKRPAASELEAWLGEWRAAEEALATPVAEDKASSPELKRSPSDVTGFLRSLSSAILAQTDDDINSSTTATGSSPVPGSSAPVLGSSAPVTPTPQPARKQGLLAGIRGMMCCAAGGSQ